MENMQNDKLLGIFKLGCCWLASKFYFRFLFQKVRLT
jgi:hypothetical protein